jgi:hypothetical protein
MGMAKHEGIRHDEKVSLASDLCVKVDALEQCDQHEDGLIDNLGGGDKHEITAEIIAADSQAINHFDDLADMENCVEEAMQRAGEECGACVARAEHG